MTNDPTISSAVLYFRAGSNHCVPSDWLDQAIKFVKYYELSPILYTAGGGGFELDDCYLFAEQGATLRLWDEVIASRQRDLFEACNRQEVHELVIDSPRSDAGSRSEWRANVSASLISSSVYIGIEAELLSDLGGLLRRTFEMSDDYFDCRYGFAYQIPLSEEPACFADGIHRTTFSDFRNWLRQRSEGTLPPKSDDELWRDELQGEKRHLTGLFRGAYPVNLLSDSHVFAADLHASGVGVLSEIGASLWLWELSPTEVPRAESWLETKRVLVRQHRPQ